MGGWGGDYGIMSVFAVEQRCHSDESVSVSLTQQAGRFCRPVRRFVKGRFLRTSPTLRKCTITEPRESNQVAAFRRVIVTMT